MLKKITLFALFATISPGLFSQGTPLELTFTAINSTVSLQLDSIKIMNTSQGGDTTLYYPDTVLSVYFVGIPEIPNNPDAFHVFQNYPNPVADQTTVSLYVPGKDKVSITVTDIMGRMIVKSERVLDQGKHSFRFTPGNGSLYFFTARWKGQSSSIKIIQAGFTAWGKNSLEYLGVEASSLEVKAMQDIQSFIFAPGDELLYIGYADTLQSGMPDSPEESRAYTFQFATNIPCPGTPTVEYEGQVYNTIQVFSQCWLKENLNAGLMVQGTEEMTDNDVIEKYCYNNSEDNCLLYGGLYQWEEMMQYTNQEGVQGICPPGWHVPTDMDWQILEGAVDDIYRIGHPEWGYTGLRGYNACRHLKSTSGWYANSGFDSFGFTALPGGCRYGGNFGSETYFAFFWTSSLFEEQYWLRALFFGEFEVLKDHNDDLGFNGYSVRCLKD